MRERLITVLDIIAPPELDIIFAELIRSPEPLIRTAAFLTLKRLDKLVVLKILHPVLKEKDSVIVVSALNTLGELGYREVCNPVIELLKTTADRTVQAACCETLGKIGNELAIPVLVEVAKGRKFLGILGGYANEVRGQATWALGRFIKDERAHKVLQKALNDASPLVRSAARLGLKPEESPPPKQDDHKKTS